MSFTTPYIIPLAPYDSAFMVEVLATNYHSPGRENSPGGYKFIGFYTYTTGGNILLHTNYIKLFGTPNGTSKLSVKFRWVCIATGQPSQWQYITAIYIPVS